MPSTDKDKVRLLISDVGGEDDESFIFTDDEINTFLGMESNLYRAAAVALRTLAANEALVHKRIQFLELKTDGPAVAKELREQATAMEERADATEPMEIAELRYLDPFVERTVRGTDL